MSDWTLVLKDKTEEELNDSRVLKILSYLSSSNISLNTDIQSLPYFNLDFGS